MELYAETELNSDSRQQLVGIIRCSVRAMKLQQLYEIIVNAF